MPNAERRSEAVIGLASARRQRNGADAFGPCALIGKLGFILQNEYRAVHDGDMGAGRLKMTLENLSFADGSIRQKEIGHLRICPILACQRNRFADWASYLRKEFTQSLAKSLAAEFGPSKLLFNPRRGIEM
jgi:hypothetical protein